MSPSTFTQNRPEADIAAHDDEFVVGKNPTIGGSSDTEVNDPIVNPTGVSPSMPVTTVTPVGKCPRTLRNSFGSISLTASTLGAHPSSRRVRPVAGTKTELRSHYRRLRREIDDQRNRSNAICRLLEAHVPASGTVMVYDAVNGEVDLHRFAEHCRNLGLTVVVPEDEPDPVAVDLVIVPGVAFTASGHRLGQGGGWYDRFLPGLRPGVQRIGVCFRECLVDEIPTEAHDITMDVVITDHAGL